MTENDHKLVSVHCVNDCKWIVVHELMMTWVWKRVIIFPSSSWNVIDFVTIELAQNLIKTGLKPLKSANVPTAVFLFFLTFATGSSTHWKGVTQNASNCIIPSSVKTITWICWIYYEARSCFKHYYFFKLNSPLKSKVRPSPRCNFFWPKKCKI